MTINLDALAALQQNHKNSTKGKSQQRKEKHNAPAKTLTERATRNVAGVANATTKPAPVSSAPTSPPKSQVTAANKPVASGAPIAPINNRLNATDAPTAAPTDVVPNDDIVAFAASLEELEKLITNDDPIRDATMQIIERCQAAPHLADFLYENEDAFAIGIRALRKLHTQRTEKRGEYRAKKQKKQENVNAFMADLQDLKL